MSNRTPSLLTFEDRDAARELAQVIHTATENYELSEPNRLTLEDGTVVNADPVYDEAWDAFWIRERTALDDLHDAVLLDGGHAFYNCMTDRMNWISEMEADDANFSG